MILGGSVSIYQGLARGERFDRVRHDQPAWGVVNCPLGVGSRSLAGQTLASSQALAVIHCYQWVDGYASLVLDDWRRLTIDSDCLQSVRGEGLAVLRRSRHAATARAVLDGLTGLGDLQPAKIDPFLAAEPLLVDLLNATLIESRPERAEAIEALSRADDPQGPRRWMIEAPPWPPASITKILERESNAMPFLETLAGQIAPEAVLRAWLLRSWLAPSKPIDLATLDDLSRAVDGRLVEEPRFRSWLRAEWAAWARQRYRRVARKAESETPSEPRAKAS